MTKKTGGLHLRRADAHGVVWIGDGLITGAASDLSRLSLGRRIAGSGKVDDDSLSTAVDVVRDQTEVGLAKALSDAEAIDDDDLRELVSEHVVDAVFDLMRWSEGVFEFVVDEPNIDDVGVTRAVEEVVTEARQRLDAWTEIDEQLAGAGTVLSLALVPDADPKLERDEWALIALVDGRRTVDDVVNLCGRGEFAVVIALADLVDRGLLRTQDDDGLAALQRRQDLVGSLESVATEEPVDEPVVDVEPAADVDVEAEPAPSEPIRRMSIAEQVKASMAEGDDEEEEDDEDSAEALAVVESSDVETGETGEASDEAVGETVDEAAEDGVAEGAEDSEDEVLAEADAAIDDDTGSSVSQIGSRSAGGRDGSGVTPHRPEPFLPSREPEHPEPLAAVAAGGGAVAAAMPAGAIERDPSVNKSLLLRLIAGVRGL